jgi:acetyltransferase EpsM
MSEMNATFLLPKRDKVLVLGTGTFAEEVADLVRDTPEFELAGFVENMNRDRCRETLDGLPIHWVDDGPALAVEHRAICGIGSVQRERFVHDASGRGLYFVTLQHPLARVSQTTVSGAGCVISAGAIIGAKSSLGEHVIVNRGALIGHHTSIGYLTTIGPGANIAGNCRLGQRVTVGMSAIVLNGLAIGDGSVIAAGAVVTKDVAPNTTVMGVPARVVQKHNEDQ